MYQFDKKELVIMFEAIQCYYKMRRFDFLPYFEKCEIRENLSNYLDSMNDINDLGLKIESLIENLDEAENS